MTSSLEFFGWVFIVSLFIAMPLFSYYFVLREESSILNPKNFDKYDFNFSKEE